MTQLLTTRKWRLENWTAAGLCFTCGQPRADGDPLYCADHGENARRTRRLKLLRQETTADLMYKLGDTYQHAEDIASVLRARGVDWPPARRPREETP